MNHKELPPQEKDGYTEQVGARDPQGEQSPALEDIEMSLEKTGDAHMSLDTNKMYMAWLKKKEEMVNSVGSDEEKLKDSISLDLDRVEILKGAGFIEEARSAFADVERTLGESRSKDIDVDKHFNRLYDLKEGLFD